MTTSPEPPEVPAVAQRESPGIPVQVVVAVAVEEVRRPLVEVEEAGPIVDAQEGPSQGVMVPIIMTAVDAVENQMVARPMVAPEAIMLIPKTAVGAVVETAITAAVVEA